MGLQTSGAISALDICEELHGERVATTMSLNDADSRDLAEVPSGTISFSDFYGKSALSIPVNLKYYLECDQEKVTAITNKGELMVAKQMYSSTGQSMSSDLNGMVGFTENAAGNIRVGMTNDAKPNHAKLFTGAGHSGLTDSALDSYIENGLAITTITDKYQSGGHIDGSFAWIFDRSARQLKNPRYYLYDDGKNPPTWQASTYTQSNISWVHTNGQYTAVVYIYPVGSRERYYIYLYKGSRTSAAPTLIMSEYVAYGSYPAIPRVYINEDATKMLVLCFSTNAEYYYLEYYTRANNSSSTAWTKDKTATFDGTNSISQDNYSVLQTQWAASADLKTVVMTSGENTVSVYRDESGTGTYTKVKDLATPPMDVWNSNSNRLYWPCRGSDYYRTPMLISADGSHVAIPLSTAWTRMASDGKSTLWTYYKGMAVYGP